MSEFENIKAGDTVVVETKAFSRYNPFTLAKVERVTKTLVFIEGSQKKYSIKDGHQNPRPDKWSFGSRIHPVTEETMKQVHDTELRYIAYELSRSDFGRLVESNPELLKQIYNLIQESEKES